MDLDGLRLFVRAAELGSFTKAAVSLGIAQPTVSRIIGELETEWDGALFYRTGRGVTLSELGEEACAKARDLLKQAEQVSEDLRGYSRVPTGHVSLGLQQSMVPWIVPDLLNQLRRERPNIRLTVHEGFSDQIERWLSQGHIDVGVQSKYWEGEAQSPPPLSTRLVLAGAAGQPPLPAEIEFTKLADYPLVLAPPTNGLRSIVDAIARRLKVNLKVAVGSDSILIQKVAALNCGYYMIKAPDTISLQGEAHLYTSSVICNPYVNRRIIMVTGNQRPMSRAVRDIADRIDGILRQRA